MDFSFVHRSGVHGKTAYPIVGVKKYLTSSNFAEHFNLFQSLAEEGYRTHVIDAAIRTCVSTFVLPAIIPSQPGA